MDIIKHTATLLTAGMILLSSCTEENTPPQASFTYTPEFGDTTTVYIFDASGSDDREDPGYALLYRWNMDADPEWEIPWSTQSKIVSRFKHTGWITISLNVKDLDGATSITTDSLMIYDENRDTSSFTDPRDGAVYESIRIGNHRWMRENLRYGEPVKHLTEPLNNGITEYYQFNDNPDNNHYGGLYTWNEAHHYKSSAVLSDICPPGWEIPTNQDFADLLNMLPAYFQTEKYLGDGSVFNLGIELLGYYYFGDPDHFLQGEFQDHNLSTGYWTRYNSNDSVPKYYPVFFHRSRWEMKRVPSSPDWIINPYFHSIEGFKSAYALYVRCIKREGYP